MTGQPPEPGKDQLQFDHADAGGDTPSGPVCAVCHKAITTYYFEAAGQVVCSTCKNKVLATTVRGVDASSFLRAVLFGLGGALAGAAVYYGVLATTGYEVGLIAILVGFMVGYSVRKGAGGRGGRRYQLLALALTYLAIGGTYVPVAIREMKRGGGLSADPLAVAAQDSAAPALTAAVTESPTPGQNPLASRPLLRVALGVLALALLAAAMPILVVVFGFPESLISALIIGFALHQAWRMTRGLKITFAGPFKVGAAPAAPAAGGTPGA